MKEINLEQGKPFVEDALYLLERQMKNINDNTIVVIHGYGSSGKGGKIKNAVHDYVDLLKEKEEIEDFIFGEDFHMFNEKARKIKTIDKDLSKYYGKNNFGITVIVL